MVYARFEQQITDAAGNVIPNLYCDVRKEDIAGAPRAQVYSDRDGATPLANPFFCDDGNVAFHVAGGAYKVRVYGTGYDETFRYKAVGRGAESDIQGLTPKGLYSAATTYALGDLVSRLTSGQYRLFASLVDDNLANTPDSATPADTAYWMYLGVIAPMISTGLHVALSDEFSSIAAITNAMRVRALGLLEIAEVRASLNEASTSGPVTVDINVDGVSILDTKLTIDQGETTSVSAAVAYVLNETTIVDDAVVSFDIDDAGSDAKGLKVSIIAVTS